MKTNLSKLAQKEYLSKYYIDAYKIAMQFKVIGPEIMDDERETLALTALYAAVANFNPTRNVKFTSFLYRLVKNKIYDLALKRGRAMKRGQPFSIKYVAPIQQDADEISDINDEALFNLGHSGYLNHTSIQTYEKLMETIKILSPNQQRIIKYLMFPKAALAAYNKKYKFQKYLNHKVIGKLLSISPKSVQIKLNTIQTVFKTVVENSTF